MTETQSTEIQLQAYRDKIQELNQEIEKWKLATKNANERLVQKAAESMAYQDIIQSFIDKLVDK